MADSQRETRLDALKTCFQGITTGNGYSLTVNEVRRGIHFEDDMPNRPALGFTNTKIRRGEFAGGVSGKVLEILIYGYVDVQPGDYDSLDDLIQAVEQRIMTASAWTYYEWTDIKDFTVYEGGAHDRLGYFDMMIEVFYHHDWASP